MTRAGGIAFIRLAQLQNSLFLDPNVTNSVFSAQSTYNVKNRPEGQPITLETVVYYLDGTLYDPGKTFNIRPKNITNRI